MADVDINAPVATAQAQRGEIKNILAGQRGEEQAFLDRYTTTITNQPKVSAIAERIGGELGLPTLRSNANMLRTELTNLPYTYSKAVTGRDVNANQLSRIVAEKAGALAPTVTAAEGALSGAERDLSTRLGYEVADRDRELLPFEMGASFMTQRQAREVTGYTSGMQNELSALIAKVNAGVTLSEGEKNRANQLAVAEMNYKNQLELQSRSIDFEREKMNTDPLGIFA